MRSIPALALAVALASCSKDSEAPSKRATLNRTGGSTFEIVPSAGQYPHCLAYTVSRSGLTRQLTMSRSNMSFECAPSRPLGGHAYRVPMNEGPVKVYVFFTSQPVNAASVSQQILDAADRQSLSVMAMRLPGNAALETLDFTPEEDVTPEVGAVVGLDAGAPADAPAPAAAPDAG